MTGAPDITCIKHQKQVRLADNRPAQGFEIVHQADGEPCDSQTFLNTEEITYGHAYGILITGSVQARQEAGR